MPLLCLSASVDESECTAGVFEYLLVAEETLQLYEDEGTNYNYEKGKYATIDFRYDETTRTLTIGERKGNFKGMLKQRRFNIVAITRDNPRELDLENPAGLMVEYNGKQVTVKL